MASVNKEELERLYISEKKSIPDIAEMLSMARSTVRARLIEFGIELRSRKDGVAAVAHKLGAGLRGKKRIFTEQWKANLKDSILRSDRVKNAAGRALKPSGYIEYTTGPHKGRSEHVVLMEEHIGRRLSSDEVVHHMDESRSNNVLSNLQLMTGIRILRLI